MRVGGFALGVATAVVPAVAVLLRFFRKSILSAVAADIRAALDEAREEWKKDLSEFMRKDLAEREFAHINQAISRIEKRLDKIESKVDGNHRG